MRQYNVGIVFVPVSAARAKEQVPGVDQGVVDPDGDVPHDVRNKLSIGPVLFVKVLGNYIISCLTWKIIIFQF